MRCFRTMVGLNCLLAFLLTGTKPSHGQKHDRRGEVESRSIDGTGNNPSNTAWGSAGVNLLRIAPADYADGTSTPGGDARPSARVISNLVLSQNDSIVNDRGLTDMVWQWGQFLDHDIDITHSAEPQELFPIPVPASDLFFDPDGDGDRSILLFRSSYDPLTGLDASNPRQQVNDITAFIDGSNVYGSDADTLDGLRSFEGGRLIVSEGDLLPIDEFGFFIAGDVRVNEQAYLIAMHTLWMREHNRLAHEFAKDHKDWSDERLFQEARRRVIAEMQVITYREFLPAILGRSAIPAYRGYREDVNPGIANSFSTAAYRFGHSMLSSELLRLNERGETIESGNLALADAFFNPELISDEGIEPYLRGLTAQAAQEIDAKVIGDVRNFLFGPPGAGGFDLASLNIQRGRDHGLPSYNVVRAAYGLAPASDFADITSDVATQESLAAAYDSVDDVDAWVGGLAEDHLPDASVGSLMWTVIRDQFIRLRDGDRFWYESSLSKEDIEKVEKTKLSDVIRRNTTIDDLRADVFRVGEDKSEESRRGSQRQRGRGR